MQTTFGFDIIGCDVPKAFVVAFLASPPQKVKSVPFKTTSKSNPAEKAGPSTGDTRLKALRKATLISVRGDMQKSPDSTFYSVHPTLERRPEENQAR